MINKSNTTKKNSVNLILGICATLFFISLGVILAINCKALYYHDIDALHIVQNSGFHESVIRENYDALIEYCSPFFKGPLEFPSLPASESGLIHFAEVKNIFVSFYYILAITFIILLVATILKVKKKDYRFLKTTAITTVVLPLFVGLACSINFDKTFVLFHKLFFRNDYWLFDPYTDPVIDILPSEFFLHAALVIIAVVLLGGILQYLLYLAFKKRNS